MSNFINYVVELSIILVCFTLLYRLLFAKDTNFRLVRFILLIGLISATIFPLLKFETATIEQVVPSLQHTQFVVWIPEFNVGGPVNDDSLNVRNWSVDNFLVVIYLVGVLFSAAFFCIQLRRLGKLASAGRTTQVKNFTIIESDQIATSFSFFRNIYLAPQSNSTADEREQIIAHEIAHAEAWHSIDLMILTLLQIVFWFNPIIRLYRKIVIQIHEFEADSRAVKDHDLDQYCSLLAKSALRSAGLQFASHFNNSLTIKRINMIRTLKSKINIWKLMTSGSALSLLFFAIACQDQIAETAEPIPAEAQSRFEIFQQAHPGEDYLLVKDDQLNSNLSSLGDKYGSPVFREEFSVTTAAEIRTFVMLQYVVNNDDPVYTVVEQMPEYPGGNEALFEMLQSNIQYPQAARNDGIEGRVFVAFTVELNGAVSNVHILKGLSPECDKESARVVKMFSKWTPGMQNGKNVRVQMVMPINFSLQ